MLFLCKICLILHAEKHEKTAQPCRFWLDYAVYVFGGDMGIRTPDLLHAKQPLSQLSYTPVFILFWHIGKVMVEATGLEPAASWSQTKHSTKLSYASPMSSSCAAKPPFDPCAFCNGFIIAHFFLKCKPFLHKKSGQNGMFIQNNLV